MHCYVETDNQSPQVLECVPGLCECPLVPQKLRVPIGRSVTKPGPVFRSSSLPSPGGGRWLPCVRRCVEMSAHPSSCCCMYVRLVPTVGLSLSSPQRLVVPPSSPFGATTPPKVHNLRALARSLVGGGVHTCSVEGPMCVPKCVCVYTYSHRRRRLLPLSRCPVSLVKAKAGGGVDRSHGN